VDPSDILRRPEPAPDGRLRYGPHPQQFLDVRSPRGNGPFPCLLNIHGGAWRAEFGLEYTGALCDDLRMLGIVTGNLEYRRVGDPGGGWPSTFGDVRSAFRFLVSEASRIRIDPSRIVVMGHSAGGQLAVWLAAKEPAVTHAISLAGILDLGRASETHLLGGAAEGLLGGTPESVPDRYRETDPMRLRVPSGHQWLIHGLDDRVVPVAYSREYFRFKSRPSAAPGGAPERVDLVEIAGAGHFELVDPRSPAFERVRNTVRRILAPDP
jgi:acetyl esterase/lipase